MYIRSCETFSVWNKGVDFPNGKKNYISTQAQVGVYTHNIDLILPF